ncbi:hypothetical protein [Bifidobacterium bombi]|uniref:Uncharacterized protein n=1 Tax=Bifidobacterium bombi DSM 19703 TaxID=1341695 RepID=A0A086BND9_9BIFI|nr:hypothetical protein [Bifidobacterium bombi]KFF30453.1 hypothetical protein BBOMB_1581 [Bifidobacterium bombi DSM 19703]
MTRPEFYLEEKKVMLAEAIDFAPLQTMTDAQMRWWVGEFRLVLFWPVLVESPPLPPVPSAGAAKKRRCRRPNGLWYALMRMVAPWFVGRTISDAACGVRKKLHEKSHPGMGGFY